MQELKLYYYPACPYCRKVTRFINKHDLKVNLKNINKDKEAARKLVEVGGKRQVPCLFIDGQALYESDDIIKWLKKNKLND
ncbi:glutaredoxin family protein [Halanaerobium hydrogeniformans]|uniref:Glutaredoxin n=1 Tax=Halanaerobium hydrogeniformans TaxID=656519 RepID=E4RMJ0_HALHG|nr:glutathione S-transferase N-terminal domain-containing protein [Halanaerobium hydrogeniformans]ADQ14521.1 glutaredoxin [Halanaerobium hydrogeniformans]